MANIGIVGGTFDPIHNGHLLLGRQAYEEYHLDSIWYMPSGQPPHKKSRIITDAKSRCDMVSLAIKGDEHFFLSKFETAREGNTYTAQTLKLLKEAYPGHEFFFIIGADSLYEIEHWYHPEQVLSSVIILAAEREYLKEHPSVDWQIAYLTEKYSCDIRKLHCQELDISSEEIRRMIGCREEISAFVPEKVEEYILCHHLYQEVS
ncbi:MAG: nicotinate (nicotinamide) nucleotide adenylyltransferase [Hungatella sp.]|nr:nicotinate (nicotinamide) nucleotide adenylyltransferase [Hungatella sp.]